MDTRIRVMTIVGYEKFYNVSELQPGQAERFIEEMPSIVLLLQVAFLNAQLFLNDHQEDYPTQKRLMLLLVLQAGDDVKKNLERVFDQFISKNQLPVIVWNYSNLLFYDLIFKSFNTKPATELTQTQHKRFFDAYLTINSITDKRFDIPAEELEAKTTEDNVPFFTVAKFMYQRDFLSTTEIHNQLVRACYLFEYLDTNSLFGKAMGSYYATLGVTGYKQLLANVMVLVTTAYSAINQGARIPIIDLSEHAGFINVPFLDAISINRYLTNYIPDLNFSLLRKGVLYRLSQYKYIVLNINFLVNYYYKAHVFWLSRFFEQQNVSKDFLSIKGKDFMEDIYFANLMKRCFPSEALFLDKAAAIEKGKQLCDAYLRINRHIGLIEFKDVTLNAEIKDSSNETKIIKAIENKFLANAYSDPKGIGQLINAIQAIKSKGIPFDPIHEDQVSQIYPIIIYTDDAFSADGVNKILNDIFQQKIKDVSLGGLVVHPLVIINLHLFEMYEDHFAKGNIDMFKLIQQYYVHVQKVDYRLTPFDLFAKMILAKELSDEVRPPAIYQKLSGDLLTSLLPSA